MAKKEIVKVEEDIDANLSLDTDPVESVEVEIKRTKTVKPKEPEREEAPVGSELVSCLRNEIIQVRHINKESGMISNPKHVFYGGMAENSIRIFTVPQLESNGQYVNVLTNQEKAFLEEYMGLPYNALSIYKKEDNYWDNYQVRLGKGETPLNLSNPNDYINYKVLLANRDFIAPSLEALQDSPKQTYQFVIVSDKEESKVSKVQLNASMEAYKEFGKIEEDFDTLKFVVETIGGRVLSKNSTIDFLQIQADKMIKSDPKMFLEAVKDPYLSTKVLIKQGLEDGIISKRGDFYYLKSDNSPLCESNQDPTLSVAAKYLNSPKRQEVKFFIEAKLNK